MKYARAAICLLLALIVVMLPTPVLADPSVQVTLSKAEHGVQTVDPDGTPVDRVLMVVENSGDVAIVSIRVDFPLGTSLAQYQDAPPAGWTIGTMGTIDDRDYVTFVGVLAPEAKDPFHLRVVALGEDDEFRITVNTPSALTSPPPSSITERVGLGSGETLCIHVPLSTAGAVTTYLPVGVVAEDTSAAVATVLYDREYRTYLDASAVTGDLAVVAPLALDVQAVGYDSTSPLGIVDTPAGPVLTAAAEALGTFDAATATLWSGLGPDAAWYVKNPGRYLVTSDAGCTPLGFAVVPPQLDSDLDGFVNINELRSNANPLSALSSPYTDDDGDGIVNGRDLVTTWRI